MNKEKIRINLECLIASCIEGIDGSWNPIGEGADGFEAMIDQLQEIANELDIKIKPYEIPEKEY